MGGGSGRMPFNGGMVAVLWDIPNSSWEVCLPESALPERISAM